MVYRLRRCQVCGKEYQPTGNGQKYCEECAPIMKKVSDAKWRKENPERVRACNAKWYMENPEQVAARSAKWRKENPEKHRASGTIWARENPAKVKAWLAKWRKENPEKARAEVVAWKRGHPEERKLDKARRRALKYANTPLDEMLTSTEWLAILAEADGHCAYCDKEARLTLDHVIPLSKGGKHSKDNVVAACTHCNCSKGNKTVEAWNTITRAQLEAAQ